MHVRCTHAEQEIFTWTDESEKGRSLTSTSSVIAAWLLISGLKKLDLQKIHTDWVIPKACPLYILADPVFSLLALIQHDGLRFLQISFLHLTLMAWNPSLSHEQVSALYREPWWSHPHTPEHIYTRIFVFHKWSLLDDSWIKPDVSQNPLFNSKQSHSHTSPPRMPFHSVNQMLIFDIMLRLVWCSVMARGHVTPIFTSLLYREGYDNSLLNEHGLFRSNPQMILLPHILVAIPTVHFTVTI